MKAILHYFLIFTPAIFYTLIIFNLYNEIISSFFNFIIIIITNSIIFILVGIGVQLINDIIKMEKNIKRLKEAINQ